MQQVNLIVNVFNGEKYLAETLESLARQDYSRLSIYCFDNHSTDKTAEIINEFASKHDNITGHSTPHHMPLVEARLFAISEIKTAVKEPFYFGFCDADDLWAPNWVSKLMAFADCNYELLICNGYHLKGQKSTPRDSCLSLSRPSPFSCPVSIRSCLFSSSVIPKESPLFDKRFPLAYDTEFWLRRGHELSYLHISDRLFHKRLHSDSATEKNFFPILRERWGMLRLHNLSLRRFLFDLLRQLRAMVFVSK